MVEELPINRAVMDMLSMPSFSPTPSPSSTPLKCHECEQANATLYCQQCEVNLCQTCDEKLHSKTLRSHRRSSPPLPPSSNPSPSSSNMCQEHGDRIFEYCLTCQMPVCELCIRYGSQNKQVKHDKHQLNLVSDVAATTRQSLETIQQSSKVSFI